VFTRSGIFCFACCQSNDKATATVVTRQLDDCEVPSLAVLASTAAPVQEEVPSH